MTAIKGKEQQNNNALKSLLPTATSVNNRRRHTYLGTTSATSEVDITSWKQNAAQSQVLQINFYFVLFYFYQLNLRVKRVNV